MPSPTAWILNLDAERELAMADGYNPNQRTTEQLKKYAPQLTSLVGSSAVVLPSNQRSEGSARGLRGFAWCPTPYALRRLRRAGALVPEAPSFACLQRVNGRRFCAELGQTLPSAHYHESLQSVLTTLEQTPTTRWLFKREFGFVGRGQRRSRSPLDSTDENWLEQSFRYGGLQVEPCVEIAQEYALHGFLAPDGNLRLGTICGQQVDGDHQWLRSFRLANGALRPAWQRELRLETERVAHALSAAGYFGPFGVDAFTYRQHDNSVCFNVRSEINARYSMGYAIGMGPVR